VWLFPEKHYLGDQWWWGKKVKQRLGMIKKGIDK